MMSIVTHELVGKGVVCPATQWAKQAKQRSVISKLFDAPGVWKNRNHAKCHGLELRVVRRRTLSILNRRGWK